MWLLAAMMITMYYWKFGNRYVSSRLGLTTFPPTRARALAENNSARPEDYSFPVVSSPFWGRSSGLAELFSANARARWRKGCEPRATTNIAFAQGSQTSNSTS